MTLSLDKGITIFCSTRPSGSNWLLPSYILYPLGEQLCFNLSSNGIRLIPILIKVKSHSIDSIEDILDTSYSYWKIYACKEIVIVLDGLDEVPKNAFLDYVTRINEFSNKFPSISIFFSCRKLFYSHFKLNENFRNFDVYDLVPLQNDQIENHIEAILKNKKTNFKNYIQQHNLQHFLYDPFYLTQLIELYRDSANDKKLPKNKPDIFDYIIERSFYSATKRKLSDGSILNQKKARYNLSIKKMALALQILGLNLLLFI